MQVIQIFKRKVLQKKIGRDRPPNNWRALIVGGLFMIGGGLMMIGSYQYSLSNQNKYITHDHTSLCWCERGKEIQTTNIGLTLSKVGMYTGGILFLGGIGWIAWPKTPKKRLTEGANPNTKSL